MNWDLKESVLKGIRKQDWRELGLPRASGLVGVIGGK